MIEHTDKIAPFDTFSEILGYDPQDCLFFDIETTGLSAASSMVFLIGTLHFDGESWILHQRLAESFAEEDALVRAFAAESAKYRTIIHFNGSTFDIPFLNAKTEDLHVRESLDLYQRFRPLKKLLSLTRMNQISLEAFVGWQRRDTATGSDMAGLYREYIRTASLAKVAWAVPARSDGSAEACSIGLRSLLLLHNHDDLIGMTQILRLAAYLALSDGQIVPQSVAYEITGQQTELQSGTRKSAGQQTGPHSISGKMEIQQARSHISGQTAFFHFVLKYALPQPLALQFTLKNTPGDPISLQTSEKNALLIVPLTCGELRFFFPDYKNYYYLPLEDQVIHKSVGAYVDKAHREPAKPANCCVRSSGRFLPQPEELFTPCLQKSYESKALYFECTEDFLKTPEKLAAYIRLLLCKII